MGDIRGGLDINTTIAVVDTHNACPQTLTINFSAGLRYRVVLHLGQHTSSIFATLFCFTKRCLEIVRQNSVIKFVNR